MKFTENKPQKRDPRVRAGEVLVNGEESVQSFDPDIHLTDEDWDKAVESLKEYRKHYDICDGALGLQASLLKLNPTRFKQVMSQLPAEVKDWYWSLGENGDDRVEDAIKKKGFEVKRRTFLKTQAREIYPDHQPPFVLSSKERAEVIESIGSGYSDDLPCFRALGLSSVLLRFPGEESNLGKEPSLILDDASWKIIMDWAKKKLETQFMDTNHLSAVVYRLTQIRTVSPERFKELTLGQTFWNQALKYLDEMRSRFWPSITRMGYAADLQLLSATEVHLNSAGVLVVEKGTRRNLKSAAPLPERDVS